MKSTILNSTDKLVSKTIELLQDRRKNVNVYIKDGEIDLSEIFYQNDISLQVEKK